MLTLALAAALAAPAPSPYDVDLAVDGALLAGMLVYSWAADLGPGGATTPAGRCELASGTHCDPARLNELDRGVVGNRSEEWAELSDAGLTTSFVLALAGSGALAFLADTHSPWRDWLSDTLVIAIAVNAASLVTHVAKHAYARPRPLQYEAATYRAALDRERSFPSGHTTATAAAMSALAMTVAYRLPDTAWPWVAGAAAAALTGFVAWGRIQAGMHFYTDVAAGAAVGAALGMLVPRLYRSHVAVSPLVDPATGAQGVALTLPY